MIEYRVIWYNLPALHKMWEDWWILSCVHDDKMIFYREEKRKRKETSLVISPSLDFIRANSHRIDIGESIDYPDYAINYKDEWLKFILYWWETDKKGKTRAELQKTFDIKRRFATWMMNKQDTKIINPITRIWSL